MSFTIDTLRGRVATYLTCDACGHPILGTAVVDAPNEVRDYERHMHAGPCPDDDDPTPDEVAA